MNETNKQIVDILFPEVTGTISTYLEKYPKRELPEGALVTRFGPSPTGFLHIGGLFAAMTSERMAHQSGGVFFLRIEDTDKKREVEDGVSAITTALARFGLKIDEGVQADGSEVGAYGPYKQSERKSIYLVFVKHLLELGFAYPCFCTSEELEATRATQEEQKIRPGYYGKWAVHRDITLAEIKSNLAAGKSFVIRLKSNGSELNKIPFTDLIKGDVSVTENDQDVVLLKSDQLPTYHFAHVVDDYLMKTTHVLRGDEWLSSLPIHLQIFDLLGFKAPHYGHISPIMKSENGARRKLSKRKDPESAVEYYLSEGYPNDSVFEYLLNIANSDFEDWRKANPNLPNTDFNIKLTKFSKSGALFDILKLSDISKGVIAKMSATEVFDLTLAWAQTYDESLAKLLNDNQDYCLKIFGIERNLEKPRKDFSKWSEVKEGIFYFFDEMFSTYTAQNKLDFGENLSNVVVKEVLQKYTAFHDHTLPKEVWFEKLKDFAETVGFARDAKAFKLDEAAFKGHVGDIAMILRVALTSKTRTPDLYEVMQTLGQDRVLGRLEAAASGQ